MLPTSLSLINLAHAISLVLSIIFQPPRLVKATATYTLTANTSNQTLQTSATDTMASNLSRATLVVNPHYKREGLKAYVHALKKCKSLTAGSA